MWPEISALESFPLRIFPQEFSPTKVKSKINHSDELTYFLLSTYSVKNLFPFTTSWKYWRLSIWFKLFKFEMLSRNVSISERLGSRIHLLSENEPKRKKIKYFPHKMNEIFLYLQNSNSEIHLSNFSWF